MYEDMDCIYFADNVAGMNVVSPRVQKEVWEYLDQLSETSDWLCSIEFQLLENYLST
jgi:hypothetical protein